MTAPNVQPDAPADEPDDEQYCLECACEFEMPRDPNDEGAYPGPDPDCKCGCH